MGKTLTLRVDQQTYKLFATFAKADNRSISNLIETAAKKHLEECFFVDEAEMELIRRNQSLLKKLRVGSKAAKTRKGRYVKSLSDL